jgi:hypothetical protein
MRLFSPSTTFSIQTASSLNTAAHAAPFPLQLTAAALDRLEDALPKHGAPMLRVHVQGGCCSGFSYGLVRTHQAG